MNPVAQHILTDRFRKLVLEPQVAKLVALGQRIVKLEVEPLELFETRDLVARLLEVEEAGT